MNGPRQQPASAAGWIQRVLAWALVLALSTSLAYGMNAGAVGALSAHPASDSLSPAAQAESNPCALDVDAALYPRWNWWVPGGRSAICRSETYPGIPSPGEMASQLTRAGRILAAMTFVAPADTRVDLYCPASSEQLSSNAPVVSASEARRLYEQVCTRAGSWD